MPGPRCPSVRATAAALGALLLLAARPAPSAPVPAPPDWLSAITGKQAAAWVAGENARSLAVLRGDPHYAPFHEEALKLAETPQRIPQPELLAGRIYNFWQDAAHVRGIWRSSDPVAYAEGTPDWRTEIDLDGLARMEHANWVWKGAICEERAEHRCLISLSDGGEDAVTLREFDLATDRFVPSGLGGGFILPRSKQQADWQDPDTLLVARDWGPGTMTTSGYAFIVKRMHRGEPLSAAQEVFRGKPGDMEVDPSTFIDGDGHRVTLIDRAIDFFDVEHYLLTGSGLRRLDLPPRSTLEGLVAGRLVVEIDQSWTAPGLGAVRSGSLIGLPLDGRAHHRP